MDLPDDLIREVELRAVMQGRRVKDLVAEVLRQGLGITPASAANRLPPSVIVEKGANGLPVITGRAARGTRSIEQSFFRLTSTPGAHSGFGL